MARWQFGLGQIMRWIGAVAVSLAIVRWSGVFAAVWLLVVVVAAVGLRLLNPQAPTELLGLKGLTAYFVVSAATLPFVNLVWIGELPLLALVQLPKLGFASGLRGIISELFGPVRKSMMLFALDDTGASFFALVLAYLIPLAGLPGGRRGTNPDEAALWTLGRHPARGGGGGLRLRVVVGPGTRAYPLLN